MKRSKILFLFLNTGFILFINQLYSQESKKNSSTNCIEKGKFIVDVYYGYPYVMGTYVKSVFINNNNNGNNSSVESVRNWNHIGGKFEYMLSDKIGIGLEYTYASVDIKYFENKNVLQNNQYVNKTFHYKATLYKQRVLARINFHFGTTDKFDPYGTIGFGYKTSLLKSNNTDDQKSINDFNSTFSNLFPIAFRFGIGARYFFTENFGLNVEAGIGGPSVQGGVTVKF
jgi:opacity protein-like surface antigen